MHQLVQQASQAPDVACVVVILILNHPRRHVLESATNSVPLLHVVQLYTPAKITDLYNVSVLYEDVLWLDVSMNQALLVQVVDTAAHLYKEIECRVLREELLLPDQVEQVSL